MLLPHKLEEGHKVWQVVGEEHKLLGKSNTLCPSPTFGGGAQGVATTNTAARRLGRLWRPNVLLGSPTGGLSFSKSAAAWLARSIQCPLALNLPLKSNVYVLLEYKSQLIPKPSMAMFARPRSVVYFLVNFLGFLFCSFVFVLFLFFSETSSREDESDHRTHQKRRQGEVSAGRLQTGTRALPFVGVSRSPILRLILD